jgi:hypothetical protein
LDGYYVCYSFTQFIYFWFSGFFYSLKIKGFQNVIFKFINFIQIKIFKKKKHLSISKNIDTSSLNNINIIDKDYKLIVDE